MYRRISRWSEQTCSRIPTVLLAKVLMPRLLRLAIYIDISLPIQVASLLGAALGIIIPTTAVFDYPTIDALAGFVTASMVGPFAFERHAPLAATSLHKACCWLHSLHHFTIEFLYTLLNHDGFNWSHPGAQKKAQTLPYRAAYCLMLFAR